MRTDSWHGGDYKELGFPGRQRCNECVLQQAGVGSSPAQVAPPQWTWPKEALTQALTTEKWEVLLPCMGNDPDRA